MDSDTIWRHIDTERAALADILEGLPADAWRVPSLCDAWTVRDVAAHLCFAQARLRDIIGPAIRSGLRYNAIDPQHARSTARSPTRRSSRPCAASSARGAPRWVSRSGRR